MRWLWRAIIVIMIVGGAPSSVWAAKRVALVIGNSAYAAVAQLPNPANDATAFAQVLKDAHFDDVELRTDLGIDAFRQALRDFAARASDADTAVFFYAGHGLEINGANILVPIDAKLRTDLDAEDETIPVDRVLRALDGVKSLRLVILDACRDNPFVATMKHAGGGSRSISRGFQRVEDAPADTVIAFATEPGSVAADGDGRHSPFTTALLDDVAVPGLDLRIALGKVRDDVLKATSGRQRPYMTGSLGGTNVALVPASGESPAPGASVPTPAILPPATQPPPPPPLDSAATDFRFASGLNSLEGWAAFLKAHPDGPLADVAHDHIARLTKAAGPAPPPLPVASPPPPPPQQATLEATPPASPRALPPMAFVVGGLDPNGDNFLALRSGPSTSAGMLRQLPPGTPLAVVGHEGAWAQVVTRDGDGGWVAARYALPAGSPSYKAPAPQPAGYAYLTGLDPNGDNFLALKTAPDLRAARIMKMGPETRMRILGHSGNWTQVQLPDGTTGWAASRYIACCTAR